MERQVATTQTPTKDPLEKQAPQDEPLEQGNGLDQSVYIADIDTIGVYPLSMSNDEIDYNIQTEVRGKTPEEYYVNFLPLKEIQDGFKNLAGMGLFGPLGMLDTAFEGSDQVKREIKKFALAIPQNETDPKKLEQTYKPWLDLWKESVVGSKVTPSDEFMAYAPSPIAAIPWFLTEFVPSELLEFGTSPINWAGAYGVEKFGPPIINKVISKLPEKVRSVLLKDIFLSEKSIKSDLEFFGLDMNAPQSKVNANFLNARRWAHPDAGGSEAAFKEVVSRYEKIIKHRGQSYADLSKFVNESGFKTTGKLLGNQRGSVLIPSPGDLVKVGDELGKLVKVSGKIAFVNIAGKVHEVPKDKLVGIKKEPPSADLPLFDKALNKEDFSEGSEEDVKLIRENLSEVMESYDKATMKEYKTSRPIVASGDLPKTMDFSFRKGFKMEDSRSRHAAASAVGKTFETKRQTDPATKGMPNLAIAGVSGAGKSTTLRKAGVDLENYALAKDSNFATMKSASRFIDESLKHGHPVDYFLVDRDIVEAFIQGNYGRFQRSKEKGEPPRIVPLDIHLHNALARTIMPELKTKYAGKDVNLKVLFNKMGNPVKVGGVDEMPSMPYTLDEANETIRKFLKNEYDNGKLNEAEYEAWTGERPEKLHADSARSKNLPGKSQSDSGVIRKSSKQGVSKEPAVNTSKLEISPEAKQKLQEATQEIRDKIENQTGQKMTHEEVIEKAKEVDILTSGVSREATLEFQASLLKTRQHLAALAEENELTPEFLDALRITANLGTDIARNLESFKIEALPEHAATKMKIIKDLIKLGKSSEEILAASKGVDFTKEQSVAEFYRKFVKPTLPELLDEYVYMNILSSPVTHITNAFSNALQLAGINPLTKLASGSIDLVASSLFGKDRQHYLSEIGDFYKGAVNALPKAVKAAKDAITGQRSLERPDLAHLPTLSKLVDVATLGVGKYVTRALEASDVFFRTMIEAGEIEALSKNLGHAPDAKELAKIKKEAIERANYYVFRKKPDEANKSGQGDLLSAIDKMTNAIYGLRKVPGMKWFIRFVQTPMNILKQGVEYSPAGFATLKGAEDKAEQTGKAMIGSMVLAGASWLAANNMTTWSSPTGAQDKNDFYAAGLQPYSVRIGDKWLSYSKLGPLAYPLAMAAALHHFSKESPNALSDTEMEKLVDALTGIMKFFSDQSYMQGVADLVGFATGQKSKAVSSAPTQLIPLSSLQGWINNIIDPLQRKAEKGLSIDSIIDNIQMKIVGMSKFVPPQIDTEEVPVKKQMRGINAVSPIKVSEVNPGKLAEYKDEQRTKQEMNKIKKEFS